MKTLDEVIKSADKWRDCVRDCDSCVCHPVTCSYECCFADALHYLKEYRSKHDEMLQMEEALGYCEMADNRPLTWEQLKQMEGKPVWIERGGWNLWVIISHIEDPDTKYERLYTHGKICPLTLYKDHHDWQAYRKERDDRE